jgi:hypothetical protein
VKRPEPRLARTLCAQPGHVLTEADGFRWRWDGQEWALLQPGDTVLAPDWVTWYVWTGRELTPTQLEAGAIVRVVWHRDGVDWDRQLCVVADIEPNKVRPEETQLLVEPWPHGGVCAVVPALVVELVAPAVQATS